jgi:hypothetical protein
MLIYCPHCKTLVCKGFEDLGSVKISFSFSVRCSKCKADFSVKIAVDPNPVTSLQINGVIVVKPGASVPKVRVLDNQQ